MNNIEKILLISLCETDYVPLWEFTWEEEIRRIEDSKKSIIRIIRIWHKKEYVKIFKSEWGKENYREVSIDNIYNSENWRSEADNKFFISVSLTKLGLAELAKSS